MENRISRGNSRQDIFISDEDRYLFLRFLEDEKDVGLPQRNSMFREFDSRFLVDKASGILGFNPEAPRKGKRIGPGEKDKRDLLIYLLWQTGRLSNREIGAFFPLRPDLFGISRRMKAMNDRISAED